MIIGAAYPVLVRYLLCWFLLAIVAIANGVVRQATYGQSVSELSAHQISTGTAILFTGLLIWGVSRLWPISTAGEAWLIGIAWLIATVTFEFGFGHFVVGHSWSKLLADYNLLEGRVWSLFLVWVTVMPYVFHRYGSATR